MTSKYSFISNKLRFFGHFRLVSSAFAEIVNRFLRVKHLEFSGGADYFLVMFVINGNNPLMVNMTCTGELKAVPPEAVGAGFQVGAEE